MLPVRAALTYNNGAIRYSWWRWSSLKLAQCKSHLSLHSLPPSHTFLPPAINWQAYASLDAGAAADPCEPSAYSYPCVTRTVHQQEVVFLIPTAARSLTLLLFLQVSPERSSDGSPFQMFLCGTFVFNFYLRTLCTFKRSRLNALHLHQGCAFGSCLDLQTPAPITFDDFENF